MMQYKAWIFMFSMVMSLLSHAGDHPSHFTKLCGQGDTCSVVSPTMVAFGANDLFVYKVVSGTFACSLHTFGTDPVPHINQKHCSIAQPTTQTPSAKKSTPTSPGLVTNGRYAIISQLSGRALSVHNASTNNHAVIIQADYQGNSNQQWYIRDLGNGYYSIRAAHSRKSLEIRNWEIEDGAAIEQFDWHNSWNQHWHLQKTEDDVYSITSRFNNKSLDLFELNTNSGADVRLWTYWGGENQHWKLIPIEAINSKKDSLKPSKKKVVEF